jgi:3-hydroxyacyl-[acyl-carrier-protein] dehydratase
VILSAGVERATKNDKSVGAMERLLHHEKHERNISMVDIPRVIPHRYPFLMVDRVLEINPGKWVKGYKNVTWNEWFITDNSCCMPCVIIVEALAQLGAFAIFGDENENGLGLLTSLKGIEFLGDAYPGDRIDLYYEVIKNRRGFVLGKGEASVGDKVVLKAEEIMIYLQSSS